MSEGLQENAMFRLCVSFAVLLMMVAVASLSAAQQYTAIDLGVIGSGSAAQAVSDTGLVTGHTNTDNGARAFFWSPAKGMIDLELLHSDDSFSFGWGINNSGAVAGYSGAFGFLW
jgi:probable HAF family extracellular repeat protein